MWAHLSTECERNCFENILEYLNKVQFFFNFHAFLFQLNLDFQFIFKQKRWVTLSVAFMTPVSTFMKHTIQNQSDCDLTFHQANRIF